MYYNELVSLFISITISGTTGNDIVLVCHKGIVLLESICVAIVDYMILFEHQMMPYNGNTP